jgi:hypothetical protein
MSQNRTAVRGAVCPSQTADAEGDVSLSNKDRSLFEVERFGIIE